MLRPKYLYIITLNEGIDPLKFEIVLREEIFPDTKVIQRNVRGTSHRLFKMESIEEQPKYIWVMQLDLVASGSVTSGVDAASDKLKEKLKDSATVSARLSEI